MDPALLPRGIMKKTFVEEEFMADLSWWQLTDL